MAWISVCKVETAKRITPVVKLSDDFTSITGRTLARAFVVFALAVSSIINDFAEMTLSRALMTKASVSMSTLVLVSVYSFSISLVMALK